MKRALAVAFGLALAIACAQQQERVRKDSEGPAEAARDGGVAAKSPDAGAPAEAAGAEGPATETAARSGAGIARPAPAISKGAGGVGLLVLPATRQALVNVQLRFRSGALDDPKGKSGLTLLTARVMSEGGTEGLDAKQLLNALFPLAAELSVRVDKEQTTFIARVHKDNLSRLLPILTDVLLHPRWDPEEFKRLREAAVNDVEKRLRQGDDENLAKEALGELMYRNHPYGRLDLGHLSDLKSLTLADLQAQARKVFTADRLTVGVSGEYPPRLGEQLAQMLASLPAKSQPAPEVPQARPHGPRFLLVEKDADSTAISMGMPWALSHREADWTALSVARSAMGEHRQMNGRLMQRLREMRGLNYGDYAYLEHFEQEGYDAATAQTGRPRHQQDFTIWLRPVRDENRLFAVRAALYELSRSLEQEPFTQEEVDRTKGFLDGYLLLYDQTDARRLGYALDDAFYGMSGFLASWRAALRDVSAEQVNAAWRKWMDPAKLEVVLSGKNVAPLKKIIVEGAPTPIQYQRDATGKTPDKPAAQLATDQEMAAFPFGAQEGDVEVTQVGKLFE